MAVLYEDMEDVSFNAIRQQEDANAPEDIDYIGMKYHA